MPAYLQHTLFIIALWPATAIAACLAIKCTPEEFSVQSSAGADVRQLMCIAACVGLAALPFELSSPQRIWLLPAAILLIALALIDWRHQCLPDRLTQPLLWAGMLCNLNRGWVPLPDALLGAITGYLSLWLLNAFYLRIRHQAGIGQGDFKLLAALGAWAGWAALPMLVSLAAGAGLSVTLARYLQGKVTLRAPLPFGVYLAAAGWLILLLNAEPGSL